jgi:hypothetical protein
MIATILTSVRLERTKMSPSTIPEAKRLRDRLEERRSRELQKLTSLLQVSQALSGTLDLRAALQEVFDTLSRHHEALGCLVALSNKDTHEVHVEAAEGLGTAGIAGHRGRCRPHREGHRERQARRRAARVDRAGSRTAARPARRLR